ncbi:MAG: hypothetical protein WC749_15875, partial [Dehalococcoidia bacterium]
MALIIVLLALLISGPMGEKTALGDDGAGVNNKTEVVTESLGDIYQQKANLTPTQQKIDSNLLQEFRGAEEAAPKAAFGAQETPEKTELSPALPPLVRMDSAGKIEVKLTVSGTNSEQLKELEDLGMNITITLPDYGIVEGWLLPTQVEAVAGLGFVTHVGTPGYPIFHSGAATSEGDAALRANLARAAFGVDGSGIKIGVMSDGVAHLANSVASGDLPSSPAVNVLKAGSGDEGTAMLEIIHDLAPGAQLAFYSPTTSSDMIVGIGALETSGCRIIVDDIGWSDEPKFEDGPIAQEARAFVSRGGVYVTACGNDAQRHYQRTYIPVDSQIKISGTTYNVHAHNYTSGEIGNGFVVPPGGRFSVTLQWKNKWGISGDDFDLFLLDSSNNAVALSGNPQNGSGNPWEYISLENVSGHSLTLYTAIIEYSLVSPPSDLTLDFSVYSPNFGIAMQYATAENSVIGHAAVEEVLSTAAVYSATPGTIELFSSRGPGTIYFPTPQTRQVPNITGTDGVSTYTGQSGHFPNPFFGTSAAAP